MPQPIHAIAMSVTLAWLVWTPLLAGCGPAQGPRHVPSTPEVVCDAGDAPGCTELGLQFAGGQGVTKDEARAAALFTKACDGGDAAGCFNLGFLFAGGQGVTQDEARAAALFTKACDGGEAKGCFNLGILFVGGLGVGKDEARAAALFTKACDGGDAEGCFNLGVLFTNGQGVAKDEARAAALFTKACDGGDLGRRDHSSSKTITVKLSSLATTTESGNGTPDVLDEAKSSLDWLVRMQNNLWFHERAY